MPSERPATVTPMDHLPLTDPATFIRLGLHAIQAEPEHQAPRITPREALAELRADCQRAELRLLMEQPS